MQEKAVGCLWEVVTESNSFIIGADNHIHGIILSLVIAFRDYALPVTAFLIMKNKLVILVTNPKILPIERYPCRINRRPFLTPQQQIGAPVHVFSTRHSKRRLEQPVVNENAQLTFLDDSLTIEYDRIGHTIYRYGILAVRR